MKFHLAVIGLLLIATFALSACGGGGSSNTPANHSQPGETVINGKA